MFTIGWIIFLGIWIYNISEEDKAKRKAAEDKEIDWRNGRL